MAGKGARLLTLGDIRDYLIDTDAVKDAEKLLLSSKEKFSEQDTAGRQKRDEARLLKSDNAADVIRQRQAKGKSQKKEELLDKLSVENQRGKLGLMREEEELQELLQLEALLRDESMTLERERMKVAAEAQSNKRSRLVILEKQAENDLVQIEQQRTTAVKELDKKRSAVEALQEELRAAEAEMDDAAAKRDSGAKAKADSKENEHSAEARNQKIMRLVTDHATAMSSAENERKSAEEELQRLMKGVFIPPNKGMGDSGSLAGNMQAKAPIDTERIEALTSEDSLTVQMQRLEKLKKAAVAEAEELNMDSLQLALAAVADAQEERRAKPGYVPYESEELNNLHPSSNGISDSLDQWLTGVSKDKPLGRLDLPRTSTTRSPAPSPANPQALVHLAKDQASAQLQQQQEQEQERRESVDSLDSDMGDASGSIDRVRNGSLKDESNRFARDRDGDMGDRRSDRGDNSALQRKANQKAQGRGPPDSEVEALKQELARARQQQQSMQQPGFQQPNPNFPYIQYPPQQNPWMQPNPYGMPAMQQPAYAQPARDPMQDAFMQQMQKMSEAMERENRELLNQLNGGGSKGDKGKGSRFAGENNQSTSANDAINRDRMATEKRRKMVAAEEMKYVDDIRMLDLEMERVRKQVELDELKYDIEKRIAQRKAEDEHMAWVDSQKKELQTMKMKQALLKEQRILDMAQKALDPTLGQNVSEFDMDANGNNMAGGKSDADKLTDMKKEESGVGASPLPMDLAKGYSVMVDGMVIPESYAHELVENGGGSYRLVVAIYDKKGTAVTPISACKWMNWEGSINNNADKKEDGDHLKMLPTDNDDATVNSTIVGSQVSSSEISDQTKVDTHVLGMIPISVKKLLKATERKLHADDKLLVEIQIKPKGQDETSMGWGVMRLSSIAESGNKTLNNGMWRVHIRVGMSDPAADPSVLPPNDPTTGDGYIQEGFIFLRIGDSADTTRQYAWKPSQSKLETEEDMLRNYADPLEAVEKAKMNAQNQKQGGSSVEGGKGAAGGEVPHDPKNPNHAKAAMAKMKAMGMLSHNSSSSTLTTIADAGHEGEDPEEEQELNVPQVKKGPEKPKVPWLIGKEPGPATEKYQKGDGVDIYLDGAMFLPDNVTVTRIVAKFMNFEKEQVGQSYECFSSLVHSAMNPTYKYKIELRGQSLNTTLTCLIRIDTLDSATMLPETIGYSCFKIFCTKDRVQPKATNEPNIYVNSGLYQLRVRGNRIQGMENYDETMLDKLPTIPCSSLLVRIRGAPRTEDGLTILSRDDVPERDWEKLGLDVAAPAYTSGEYYGASCEPDEMETFCYPTKVPNKSTTVDGALSLALSSIADKPGAPKFSARPTAAGDEALTKWLESLLPKATEMKHLLDYSLISPYSLDSGLCVSVDMLFNMPEVRGGVFSTPPGTIFKVIYSIVPPGLFYKDPPMSEEVVFTKAENYERPYRAPVFLDGYNYFHPPLLDNQSYVVIEVRQLTISPAIDKTLSKQQRNTDPDIKVEPNGAGTSYWTLLPVSKERFDGSGYKYTVSGTFQLPLIKGPIPSIDLFNAEQADPLQELFSRLGPKGKSAPKGSSAALALADGCSIIVRVCNPVFKKMLPFAARQPDDPDRGPHTSGAGGINTELMMRMIQTASAGITGPIGADKFKYDPAKFNLAKGEKTTLQRLPGNGAGLDLKKFAKNVNKLFSLRTQINIDP